MKTQEEILTLINSLDVPKQDKIKITYAYSKSMIAKTNQVQAFRDSLNDIELFNKILNKQISVI